ncbi:adenosylcobinamide-GDP ribazoletransferase [Shewanella intestini]|uniref:Adenosylcobinamide-GDP ribazoletransferase n=1 Tax=Shewanella intestini TaxID=2017544 RepID=A0ABS5I1Q7_9GAMM|nr:MULTISPECIES: adenosylcobinamide-GDP ribazoletransferase [Shewanella]MBR9727943.1 adenosylcobinamide-GDP ribazoletransferase [Shewanella intestini]MRG36506.1 adenosylcobinamide-GDP ribazoletransferase [Shewanella sp. XMDDZSB0408]
MKKYASEVLAAASFLTRLPMPVWVINDNIAIAKASRWFALIGIFIGSLGAGLLYGLTPILGELLAAALTLVILICFTGAFHEDGLADMADGFGGGWEKSRKLAIMKDSQIGTYGVLALIASFSIKMAALVQLPLALACVGLIVCHSTSRAIAGCVMQFLPYARAGDNNKTPQKNAQVSFKNQLILLSCGALPLLLLPLNVIPLLLSIWLVSFWMLIQLMKRHIQGYTGDTLGATQQIIEITGLISLVIYHVQTVTI